MPLRDPGGALCFDAVRGPVPVFLPASRYRYPFYPGGIGEVAVRTLTPTLDTMLPVNTSLSRVLGFMVSHKKAALVCAMSFTFLNTAVTLSQYLRPALAQASSPEPRSALASDSSFVCVRTASLSAPALPCVHPRPTSPQLPSAAR